jgi:glycosyltransferase involved in cell wall biosynthesis
VVLPVFNEAKNLATLKNDLDEVLPELKLSYEIIFVDDGSVDRSFEVLQHLYESDPRVRVLQLRRNFGQTAAFSAGFDIAQGDIVVTMDSDLQNDPRDIPHLLEEIQQGADIVSGWRFHRRDPLLTRKIPSWVANKLISWLTNVKLHDYGCSLKAYRREVIKNVKLYGEMHRFIPALANWMGIEVVEVKVSHHSRRFGRSKYGINRTLRVFLDLITVKFLLDFAVRPIQVFGLAGFIFASIGGAIGLYLSVEKLFFHAQLADRPLLLLAVLLMVLGFQSITFGLLGELVTRTYHEAREQSTYVVKTFLRRDLSKEPSATDETGLRPRAIEDWARLSRR